MWLQTRRVLLDLNRIQKHKKGSGKKSHPEWRESQEVVADGGALGAELQL
jgi:hypothetical protein